MLNSRNVILFTLTIAMLSILGTVINLSMPPDGGGRRADSYGTRRYGHRALIDLLRTLKIPVERGLAPPGAVLRNDRALVLWAPLEDLVKYEPEHLKRVGEWARQGGRVVIAHESNQASLFELNTPKPKTPNKRQVGTTDISSIDALGLNGVVFTKFDIEDKSAERTQRMQQIKTGSIWDMPPPIERPTGMLEMKTDGSLATLFGNNPDGSPRTLTLFAPYEDIQVLDLVTDRKPIGRIFHKQKDGVERTFIAEYEMGQGRVIVVSEPALFENYYMQSADNPIVAARILHAQGRSVIFDEFYHGLTVRGNPFWLLTKQPFGILFFASFIAVAVFTLRRAVHLGPALGEKGPSRRTLAEYIAAMSNLFHRTGHFKFVLKEVRDGTVWNTRRKLGLAPQHEDLGRILAVLGRKHPADAQRLKEAVAFADEILAGRRPATGLMVLQAGRKLSECL